MDVIQHTDEVSIKRVEHTDRVVIFVFVSLHLSHALQTLLLVAVVSVEVVSGEVEVIMMILGWIITVELSTWDTRERRLVTSLCCTRLKAATLIHGECT
jgi:hypothetical protein